MFKIKNKKVHISVVVFIAFGLIITSYFIVSFIKVYNYQQINIFSDITECNVLDNIKTEDDLLNDRYIGDIPYKKSYIHKLNYDSKIFEIYAYEFDNQEDAMQYYFKVKGRTSEQEISYHGRTNMFSSDLIVRNDKNVYRIEAGNTFEYIDIQRYLNSIFTVKITEGVKF